MKRVPSLTFPSGWLLPILARGGCFLLALLAALPLVAFVVARPPAAAVVLVAALFAVTTRWPERAWVAFAVVSPFGVVIGRMTGWGWSLTEPLILSFLAGWLLAQSIRGRPTGGPAPRRQPPPVLDLAALLALAITASLVVQLAVIQVSSLFPVEFIRFVWRFFWHDYYTRPADLGAVSGAAFALEGVGLFAATVVLVRRRPSLGRGGAAGLVAAAAGVAAVNFGECIRQWLPRFRDTGWQDLLAVRVSSVFPDVNAAGSYFLLAAATAIGLAAGGGKESWAWRLAAGCAVVGLWASGSRTAFAVALLVVIAASAFIAFRRGLGGIAPAARIAFLALGILAIGYLATSLRTPTRNIEWAVAWRVKMGDVALRMFRDHPVFGVGAGGFYELSYDYLSPEARRSFPRENAHNNFLQILAELGVVGFGLLTGLLVMIAVRAYRALSWPELPRWCLGIEAGLAAFVLTWLGGHPMLTREVAVAFWLALGLGAAMLWPQAGEADGTTARSRRRWPVWVLAAAIILAVPIRAQRRIADADLTRDGMGLSQWHVGSDSARFRWMMHRAVVYVPASARIAAVPLRSPDGIATVRITPEGGQRVQVVVSGSEWRDVPLRLPPRAGRTWIPVELQVRAFQITVGPPADGKARIQVGLIKTD